MTAYGDFLLAIIYASILVTLQSVLSLSQQTTSDTCVSRNLSSEVYQKLVMLKSLFLDWKIGNTISYSAA